MRKYKMYQYPRGDNPGGGTRHRYMSDHFLFLMAT